MKDTIKSVLFDFNRTLFDPLTNSLFPETIIVLEKLQPLFSLGLISLGEQQDRREQISKLGLTNYFDHIAVVDKKTKDDFLSFCNITKSKPESTMVVGDRVQSEITIANELGMITVWFRNGKFADITPSSKHETPNYTITKLNQLLKYLH